MKRKNAFAFRDFDATRILQRPQLAKNHYYQGIGDWYFNLPSVEDFRVLELWRNDIVDNLERDRYDLANAAHIRYHKRQFVIEQLKYRLDRHTARLQKVLSQLEKKFFIAAASELEFYRDQIKRARELLSQYEKIERCVENLVAEISKKLADIEFECNGRYRVQFAARLRKARLAAKLTQSQLAEKIGRSQSNYSNYESGNSEPSLAVLVKLSRILKVSVDTLVGT